MSELPPDNSFIRGAAADPARRRVAAYKAHGTQTFAVTSAPAAMPITDPVESAAFFRS